MNILAAILYFKMADMKSNVQNIFIIRTGRMVILMAKPYIFMINESNSKIKS